MCTNRYKFSLSKGFPIHLVNDNHKPTRQSMQFADQMKLKAPLKPIDPCSIQDTHRTSILFVIQDCGQSLRTTNIKKLDRYLFKYREKCRNNTELLTRNISVTDIQETIYVTEKEMREQTCERRRYVFVGISVQLYL